MVALEFVAQPAATRKQSPPAGHEQNKIDAPNCQNEGSANVISLKQVQRRIQRDESHRNQLGNIPGELLAVAKLNIAVNAKNVATDKPNHQGTYKERPVFA